MGKNTFRIFSLIGVIILLILGVSIKNKLTLISSTKIIQPFSNIKPNLLKQIIFDNGIQKNVIYNKDNVWYIKLNNIEYKADQTRIDNIINSISSIKKDNVVSTNKKKHVEFGIDKQSVTIETNIGKQIIYIGKNYSINKNYLRINNENEVIIGNGFDTVFYPEDYRDLSVNFIQDESKVTNISISQFDIVKLDLEYKNNKWLTKSNTEIKKEKVDFLINDLKTLKASNFITDEQFNNIQSGEYLTINIKENNKEKIANFYTINNNTEQYLLKTNQSNLIFEVASANVQSVNKKEEDLAN